MVTRNARSLPSWPRPPTAAPNTPSQARPFIPDTIDPTPPQTARPKKPPLQLPQTAPNRPTASEGLLPFLRQLPPSFRAAHIEDVLLLSIDLLLRRLRLPRHGLRVHAVHLLLGAIPI